MQLKAFKVFPGETPADEGCVLVFAETAGKAKKIGCDSWPGIGVEYIDFRAWRVPYYDRYADELEHPAYFEVNTDLPADWKPFFDNCLTCTDVGINSYPAYPSVL